jgi:FMN phosphatase YigB (HAD superfamily)
MSKIPPDVKWFGIDFAFTIMNPLTLHHSAVIPEMYKRLGRQREGPKRLAKWYKLRDSMGTPGDQPHQKVRLLKEYNRDRLYTEVFDDDPAVIDLYAEMEALERRPPDDLKAALEYLKRKKKSLSVVSEVSGVKGTLTVSASLRAHPLLGLFDELITPAGRFTPEGKLLDETAFAGATKKDGTIYERLAVYLDSKGIHAGQRAIVGDDPKLDVEYAKRCGFVTIQYTGVIDRGRTDKADYLLARWSELPGLL